MIFLPFSHLVLDLLKFISIRIYTPFNYQNGVVINNNTS